MTQPSPTSTASRKRTSSTSSKRFMRAGITATGAIGTLVHYHNLKNLV